jgi:hypothetical protein
MVINGHKSNDVKPIHDFYFSGWQSISDVAVCHGCHGFHVTFPLRDMEAGRGSEWGLSGVTLGSPGTTWYWGYYNIRLGTYLWLWEPNISYYNSCNREGVLYIGELYYILCCFQRFDYVWLCLTMFGWFKLSFPFFGHQICWWRYSAQDFIMLFVDDLHALVIHPLHLMVMWIELSNDLEPWATHKNNDRMLTLTTFNHYPFMTLTTVCPWIFSHELSKIVRSTPLWSTPLWIYFVFWMKTTDSMASWTLREICIILYTA